MRYYYTTAALLYPFTACAEHFCRNDAGVSLYLCLKSLMKCEILANPHSMPISDTVREVDANIILARSSLCSIIQR